MSDETRRRVAEALGWRVVLVTCGDSEYKEWALEKPNGSLTPILGGGLENASKEEAWELAMRPGGEVPDWPNNPADALALLAGCDWQASHSELGRDKMIYIIIFGSTGEAHKGPPANWYNAGALVENGDEARAFAQAATAAWCAWRGA